jgi:hypothetical protein
MPRWVVIPEGAPVNGQQNLSQVLAVHAALLPGGGVLFFGGSEHIYGAAERNRIGVDNTRVWDPRSGEVLPVTSPVPPYDLFCCGHCHLADGKLLVAGGTSGYIEGSTADPHISHAHYRGSRRVALFDPARLGQSPPWLPANDLTSYGPGKRI